MGVGLAHPLYIPGESWLDPSFTAVMRRHIALSDKLSKHHLRLGPRIFTWPIQPPNFRSSLDSRH
ncbi:hypothetical protein M378DRAFT_173378 [Amanita muscaria Koide BX008]|uniref:Uncharacterized protein n=1 Tax=Amanita muscaria (strain Koide BX008) TaxID=946122 RepID=A0A0C2WI04_AMAMK|nr:hypothetical protein M378DRAFT_173378 [Amanita muscaria Koide BX008]